jgi:hypothetical protein
MRIPGRDPGSRAHGHSPYLGAEPCPGSPAGISARNCTSLVLTCLLYWPSDRMVLAVLHQAKRTCLHSRSILVLLYKCDLQIQTPTERSGRVTRTDGAAARLGITNHSKGNEVYGAAALGGAEEVEYVRPFYERRCCSLPAGTLSC